MYVRTLATLCLSMGLVWGCGSPELSAAQTAAATEVVAAESASGSAETASVLAAAPTTVAQNVSRSGTAPTTSTPTTPAPTTAATPSASTNLLLARTVKILPIGDSMTVGNEFDPTAFRSYRGRLHQLLVSAGYQVDFVGTQQRVPFIGGDPDHDGYGGAWIGPGGSANNLADRLAGILAATDPDIVVLAFGWNSVYSEPSVAAAKYRDFVARLTVLRPGTHLVVATLSPQRGESEAASNAGVAGFSSFNAMARSLGTASATDRIHIADFAAAGFQASEYWDVIHWLQPGADRAAQVLYRTLVDGPLKR
jgi:hypothetical protein